MGENKDHEVNEPDEEKKISFSKLAKQLKSGEIDPSSLNKDVLQPLAFFLKSRGEDTHDIAELFELDVRTIQRYISEGREDNVLIYDRNFQKRVADDFYRNWQSRYQRVLKESFSEELSSMERVKVMRILNQMDICGIEGMRKLGYISEQHGKEESKMFEEHSKKIRDQFFSKETMAILSANTKKLSEFKGSPQEGLELLQKIKEEEGPLMKIHWNSIIEEFERRNNVKIKDNFSSMTN